MKDWKKIKPKNLDKILKKYKYFSQKLDQLAQLQLDCEMQNY